MQKSMLEMVIGGAERRYFCEFDKDGNPMWTHSIYIVYLKMPLNKVDNMEGLIEYLKDAQARTIVLFHRAYDVITLRIVKFRDDDAIMETMTPANIIRQLIATAVKAKLRADIYDPEWDPKTEIVRYIFGHTLVEREDGTHKLFERNADMMLCPNFRNLTVQSG